MYRIVYEEEHCKKSIWCYGRECCISLCCSLYQSPYIDTIIIYDTDDNIIDTWGLV